MSDLNVLMQRTDLLLDQKRYKDAESTIRQVLEQEPRNDLALSLLARCYINNKRVDEGISVIKEAIAVSPNNGYYFYLLGFAWYHKNVYKEADTNLRKAIHLNPYEPEYFGLLSFVLLEAKDFEAALDAANSGLQVDAENITCLNARSTALNKLRRTSDAISTMQDALAQDPDNQLTHVTVGWNLLEKGRNREAEKHFMEALRIDPDYVAAKNGMKESLKSRILPYKWMLQYSFWIQTKSKGVQKALPFVIYIIFRILIGLFKEEGTGGKIAFALGGLYILLLVTSWTINSIANFFLLFHKTGKYALTHNEKWAAINVVMAMTAGIGAMIIGSVTKWLEETPYDSLFLAGVITLSLALPLGRIDYPLKLRGNKHWFFPALLLFGLASLVVYSIAPPAGVALFIIYGIAFVIYSWVGVFR